MTKVTPGLSDKILSSIYFIGFEVLLYQVLSFLLIDQVEKNPDKQEAIIVQNWNSFVYFVLLYAAITIGTMLLLTSALSRQYKPQIMVYFWFSWPGLLIMLLLAFN